jgi:hypothetical protein
MIRYPLQMLATRAAVCCAMLGVGLPAIACPCTDSVPGDTPLQVANLDGGGSAVNSASACCCCPPTNGDAPPRDIDHELPTSPLPKPCSCPPGCSQTNSGKLPVCATQMAELMVDNSREELLPIVSQTCESNPNIQDIFRPPRA